MLPTKRVNILASLAFPCILALILLWLPIDTTLSLGADEGIELEKSLLFSKHPKLAAKMWNDQPWLHTMICGSLFRIFGNHAGIPRLLSYLSLLALAVALGHLLCRTAGILGVVVVTLFFIAQKELFPLFFSAMLEFPAISWAVVAVAIAWLPENTPSQYRYFLSGIVLGFSAQIKLTALIVAPALVVLLFSVYGFRQSLRRLFFLLSGSIAAYLLIAMLSPSFSLNDLLRTHATASTRMPDALRGVYIFRAEMLLENPALMLTSIVGLGVAIQRRSPTDLFSITLLITGFGIALLHRPWWHYYLLHIHIPQCLLAAEGCAWMYRGTKSSLTGYRRSERTEALESVHVMLLSGIFSLWVAYSMTSTIATVKEMIETKDPESRFILSSMRRYTSQTKWCYTNARAYAFQAGVEIPPELIVNVFKRHWTDDLDDNKILEIAKRYTPQMLLLSRGAELSNDKWRAWITNQYQLEERSEGMELWVSNELQPQKYSNNADHLRLLGL